MIAQKASYSCIDMDIDSLLWETNSFRIGNWSPSNLYLAQRNEQCDQINQSET